MTTGTTTMTADGLSMKASPHHRQAVFLIDPDAITLTSTAAADLKVQTTYDNGTTWHTIVSYGFTATDDGTEGNAASWPRALACPMPMAREGPFLASENADANGRNLPIGMDLRVVLTYTDTAGSPSIQTAVWAWLYD